MSSVVDEFNRVQRMGDEMHRQQEQQWKKMAASIQANQERQEKLDAAQVQTAEELRKMREQYEADLKEQAKESRVNRWMNVGSLLVATASLLVAIFK